MWRSSESGSAKNQNQMTGPRGQCEEAVHIIDNKDHECGQAYCNRCSEDVVLYSGYQCVLPKGFEKLKQKNLKCYQMAKSEWRKYEGGEQTHDPRIGIMDCQESDLGRS